jgi:hypothetical protein
LLILVHDKEPILINSCLDILRVHANILVLDGLRRGSMVFPILSSSLPESSCLTLLAILVIYVNIIHDFHFKNRSM